MVLFYFLKKYLIKQRKINTQKHTNLKNLLFYITCLVKFFLTTLFALHVNSRNIFHIYKRKASVTVLNERK